MENIYIKLRNQQAVGEEDVFLKDSICAFILAYSKAFETIKLSKGRAIIFKN